MSFRSSFMLTIGWYTLLWCVVSEGLGRCSLGLTFVRDKRMMIACAKRSKKKKSSPRINTFYSQIIRKEEEKVHHHGLMFSTISSYDLSWNHSWQVRKYRFSNTHRRERKARRFFNPHHPMNYHSFIQYSPYQYSFITIRMNSSIKTGCHTLPCGLAWWQFIVRRDTGSSFTLQQGVRGHLEMNAVWARTGGSRSLPTLWDQQLPRQ